MRWEKLGKLGIVGILAAGLFWFGSKILDAIIETEFQGVWNDNLKPALGQTQSISFSLWQWILVAAVMMIVIACAILIASRTVSSGRKRRPKSPVKSNQDETSDVDVFRPYQAYRLAKRGEIDASHAAHIITQSINRNELNSWRASVLLARLDYELVLEPNRMYSARPRRDKKS